MTSHKAGLHHYHKQKRLLKKKETIMIHGLDRFMYLIAIVMPLTTLPQIIQIWESGSAENISIFTWSAYVFSGACWLGYSIVHREKVRIINSFLWVLLNATVVTGIVIYG